MVQGLETSLVDLTLVTCGLDLEAPGVKNTRLSNQPDYLSTMLMTKLGYNNYIWKSIYKSGAKITTLITPSFINMFTFYTWVSLNTSAVVETIKSVNMIDTWWSETWWFETKNQQSETKTETKTESSCVYMHYIIHKGNQDELKLCVELLLT